MIVHFLKSRTKSIFKIWVQFRPLFGGTCIHDTGTKEAGGLFGSARVDDTEEKLQELFDGLLQKSDDGEFMSHD